MAVSPPPPSPSLMRRLSLVRYLYEAGLEQSRRSSAVAGLAILSLHDATEMFLQAAAEHRQAVGSKDFMGHWPSLEKCGVTLGRREEMKQFNHARNSLKHDGRRPNPHDVEGYRETVRAFLVEEFPNVFGVQLAEASLSSLVKSEKVRALLLEAERAVREPDYSKAIEGAARSFRLTLREHAEECELVRPGLRHPRFLSLFGIHDLDRRLEDAFRDMSYDFGEQITILAHHLDYDGYLYLKTYGPVIHELIGGHLQLEWTQDTSRLTEVIAKRCVDFAVDAALTLEGK